MKNIAIVFIYLVTIGPALSAPKDILVIKTKFQRNKDIWGTYKQLSESIKSNKRKSKKLINRNIPFSNLVIQKGKFVFIRPTTEGLKTTFKVQTIPYKKNGKNSYTLKDNQDQEQLFSFFESQINKKLKVNGIRDKYKFGNIQCKKSRRKFIECNFPLQLKEL